MSLSTTEPDAVINDDGLDLILRKARTYNAWLDKPVGETLLRQVYDLARMGPTSANMCPLRIVFVKSRDAKERLKPALDAGNVAKTLAAPVTAIFGMEIHFYEQLPKLFPHGDARAMFKALPNDVLEYMALRNSSLQGAYFILAARALGLDCGPMSGFVNAKVDAEFFAGTTVKSNFLCNLGYGDDTKLYPRSPRLDFEEACRIVLWRRGLPRIRTCSPVARHGVHAYHPPTESQVTSHEPSESGAAAMSMKTTKTVLTLLMLLSIPLAAEAFERGKVERFATLPAGEAHPEGICVDHEGNVYVVTVAANKPDTSGGTLIVFDPKGKHLRTVTIAGSTPWLLDLRFHPQTGKLLVVDYKAANVLSVDPMTGASSVFMTVSSENPGLDGLTIDAAGNVYVTDAHAGMIWKVSQEGGAGTAWVTSPLLKPTRPPPPIGANGLAFNNRETALFVANTAQDTIVKIPVSGSPLGPGTPEVFVNRAGGGPDGLIIDELDNLWIACNQSNEIMVLEPQQGRVIAKLGDFGGIDKDGAPIGLLWSNSLVFHGGAVLVTNLSFDIGALRSTLRTVDGPWAAQVTLHTISKIAKRIPPFSK